MVIAFYCYLLLDLIVLFVYRVLATCIPAAGQERTLVAVYESQCTKIKQCLQVYGFIHNFTEINEILQVKSAELRIFKHPAPPLFMHVHSV